MIAVPVGETEVIVIESRRNPGFDRGVLRGYDRDVVNNGGVLVYTVDSSLSELPIRYAIGRRRGHLGPVSYHTGRNKHHCRKGVPTP